LLFKKPGLARLGFFCLLTNAEVAATAANIRIMLSSSHYLLDLEHEERVGPIDCFDRISSWTRIRLRAASGIGSPATP
jgi:hypothetical protein